MVKEPDIIHAIQEKVLHGQRITSNDALTLFHNATLGELATMADIVRQRFNGNTVYYIRNTHIEPTNICRNKCKFCSYRHSEGDTGSYKLSGQQVLNKIKSAGLITEVHIVGGLHPDFNLDYYTRLFSSIRIEFPDVHRKGLTAEEIKYLSDLSGYSFFDLIKMLISSGLQSMPGGGAEIFDPEIRQKICPDKLTGAEWLEVHETAHKLGLPTNATILYGHIENSEHRVAHLESIRHLQDQTHGFNAFIPLKYKLSQNQLGLTSEVSLTEDLKMFAISRIFLDNIPHIKAYWPMLGLQNALLMLSFGADDLDGTITQSTGIYATTGNIGQKGISVNQLCASIKAEGKVPVERDTLYNQID
jgi:aminodeoxyfutalosine synthase